MKPIKFQTDPLETIGTERLIESLLDHVEFSELPVEMIGTELLRARAILAAIDGSEGAANLADAAQSHVEVAFALINAWHRQATRGRA